MRARLAAWAAALDDRTGAGAALAWLRAWPVAGRPGWARATGGALLLAVALQVTTGVGLAALYAPATTTAWESVWFLEERVPLGAVVRGLHAFGAGAVVALGAAHLALAALRRAYRAPGEAAWAASLLLVAPVVLAFGLTGYLLPWDQRGYWATRVSTGIAASTPVVGPLAERALLGGVEPGQLTLTRFYALHTVVLPGLLALGLVVVALLARRAAARAGAPCDGPREAGPAAGCPSGDGPGGEAPSPSAAPGRWWPRQAARDVALAAALALVALALAVTEGAGLEAPADPASDYPPRPEWWFAPLRQLLKTVPEPWGSVVLPGLLALALLALPWLDPARRPRTTLARGLVLGPLALALVLGLTAWAEDRADAGYQAARAAAAADAALARRLARDGIPPEGAGALLERHPPRLGARLYRTHCLACHRLDGEGGEGAEGKSVGPELTGYLGRAWLEGVVRAPRDPRFFGRTKIDGMEPLPREHWGDLPALAAFVRAQDPEVRPRLDPALVAAGEEAYYAQECHACHGLEPGELGGGPNLHGYGTTAWLVDFLRDPGADLFYGADNEMPGYADELTRAELEALAAFLRGLDPDAPRD